MSTTRIFGVQVIVLAVLVFLGLLLFTLFAQLTGAMDLRRIVRGVLRRT